MRLLLVLDEVDYPLAVNPRLAMQVAAVLARQGHQVDLLRLWDGLTPLSPPPAGCEQFVLPFADERRMNEALEHGNAAGAPIPVRLARLALRPDAGLAAVRLLWLRRPRRQAACKREILRLHALRRYDAALAVAAPYHAALALGRAHGSFRRAAWLMDPYSQRRSGRVNAKMLPEETALYERMDHIFVTRLMAPDYAPGGPFAQFEDKAQVLEFPALLMPPGQPLPADGEEDGGEGSGAHGAGLPPGLPGTAPPPLPGGDKPIRCVFVGSLYAQVRTPEFALALFTALNDPRVELHFYGGGWEHFPPDSPVGRAAARAREILGDRFSVFGPVPPEKARRVTAEADVLLSLGNDLPNQLPSKVFEYFGTGLPVLHLARRTDDPALPYFTRYPASCTLQQQEGCTPDTLDKLSRFLHTYAGRRLPFSEVRRLFEENTPEAVAARLLELLQQNPNF